MRIMGCDIARLGSDQSVFCIRNYENGIYIIEGFEEHSKTKTNELTDIIEASFRNWHLMFISIDAIGIGAGVADNLEERMIPLFRVIGGAKAFRPKEFKDLRSELYWRLRQAFEKRAIKFKNVTPEQKNRIILELSSIKYYYTRSGQIKFESKEEIIKRIGKSPDYADALAYTMVGEQEWLNGGTGIGQDLEIDYGEVSQYRKGTWAAEEDEDIYSPEDGHFGDVPIIM